MKDGLTEEMINVDLRDIHLPDDVPWWPLANGWWLLIALFIIVIICIYCFRRYLLKRHSLSYLAKKELCLIQQQRNSPEAYFKALYLLLRQIVRLLPGAEQYNRDESCQWFLWLLEQCELSVCSEELQQQLTIIPYTNKSNKSIEINELEQLTIRIIDNLPEIRLLQNEVMLNMEKHHA